MKKILFLHGFYASGQCVPAIALKEALKDKVEVLTPDLPMHPKEAVNYIRDLIDREKPDALVGNSCGSFYAQMIASTLGLPALLGNPHFKMTEFLKPRIGAHQYKSPRKDGQQDFIIDEKLIAEFTGRHTSLTPTFQPIRIVFGASSVNKTRWHILSHYSYSTTLTRFIFLVATRLQPRKYTSTMYH